MFLKQKIIFKLGSQTQNLKLFITLQEVRGRQ